ncbi:PKD (Partial), partial [Seminavis robusta]
GNFGACTVNRQASRVQWPSNDGTMYYLLIHGFGAREGDFQLNVINYNPINQDPEKAYDISPGDMVVGTTFQAIHPWDGDSTNCGGRHGLIGESPSVWYRVQGTGGTLRASTCNPQTEDDFNSVLHIFEGSTDINRCFAGNDDLASPDRCAQIDWPSSAGQTYYILVHGRLGDQGLFELSVDSV